MPVHLAPSADPQGRPSWAPKQESRSLPPSLTETYERLLDHYGPQNWWPADSAFEVLVGAILVQSTAWRNVEHAIANLRDADSLHPAAIRSMSIQELEGLIRPSGFYRVKAKRLRALCEFLGDEYADSVQLMEERPTHDLRRELLNVYGVGEETADDILLYALGRPVFVVDAFTHRIFHRLGWCEFDAKYGHLQTMFHDRLPGEAALYNEYHALIVRHGNTTCKKRPDCNRCPLLSSCPRIGL